MSLIDSRSHTLVGCSAHRASRAAFNDPSGSDTSGIRTPRTYGLALTGEVKNYSYVTLHEHVCDFNDIEAHFSGFFLYDGGRGDRVPPGDAGRRRWHRCPPRRQLATELSRPLLGLLPRRGRALGAGGNVD